MQLVIQIGGFDNPTIVAQAILGGLRSNRSVFGIISRQLGDWTKIRFEYFQEIVWADLKASRILLDPRDVEDQKDAPRRFIRIISDLGWINDQIVNAVCCAVPGEYSLEVCDLRLSSTRESGPSFNFFSTPPRTKVPFYRKPSILLIVTPPKAFRHED